MCEILKNFMFKIFQTKRNNFLLFRTLLLHSGKPDANNIINLKCEETNFGMLNVMNEPEEL